MPKVERVGSKGTAGGAGGVAALSATERNAILSMIKSELKLQGGADEFSTAKGRKLGGRAVALYVAPAPGRGGGRVVPEYIAPRPEPGPIRPVYIAPAPRPGPGGGIVARYIAPGPGIVPKYMVVPPWGGIDAHLALINRVTRDGKVTTKEATLIRKLFNRDIMEAAKEGRDIRPQVARYLHRVLDNVKMDKGAQHLIFGKGGPGCTPKPSPGPIVPMYMVVRPDF
ncbi:MAG: hypothetical protein HYZ28_09430 [Myxococcales bacterium]|nr:hypothetical protein [Myxococcales bacterium]